MLSISTCWNSHRHEEDGMHMVHEALLLGFDHLTLGSAVNPVLLPAFRRIVKQKKSALSFSGVDARCLCSHNKPASSAPPELTSIDENQRKSAIELSKQAMDLATDLQAGHVSLLLGHSALKDYSSQLSAMLSEGELYSKTYAALKLQMVQEREALKGSHLDGVRWALDELIPYAQERRLRLGLQSRKFYEQVPNEREMESLLSDYDSPTLGYIHDFGHTQVKENLGLLDHQQYLQAMSPWLIACHLHDVVWPMDDHHIPCKASIDFDRLMPLVPENIPIIWTMSPRRKSNDIKQALVAWKEKYSD